MRSRIVTRYYCDFCKKAGFVRKWIVKHERACTANPNRICGVCEMMDFSPEPLAQLIELTKFLAVPLAVGAEGDGLLTLDIGGLNTVRVVAGGCPACVLAALRQSNVYCSDFDYKKEMAPVLAKCNEEREYEMNQFRSSYG